MSGNEQKPVTLEQVHAYFDDELDVRERECVEQALRTDPALQNELQNLEALRTTVVAGLDAASEAVPEARFEQIWDQVDAAIDREARLREAADRDASIWARVGIWLRPLRWPAAAAAAAAAIAIFVMRSGSEGGPANKPDQVASVESEPTVREQDQDQDRATPPPAREAADIEPSRLADGRRPGSAESSDDGALPAPERNDAELEVIDFGGKAGRISRIEGQRGTTTVIWVTEEEPVDSERSL